MSEQPTAKFCGACGTPIHGGNFCTNCGTPSGVHQAITPAMAAAALSSGDPLGADAPAADAEGAPNGRAPVSTDRFERATDTTAPPPEPAPKRARGNRRWALIAAIAAAIAAGVVLVVILTNPDEPGTNAATGAGDATVYQQQVAKVFGPVLGANQQVSDQLAAVRGTQPNDARLAVRRAQLATTQATGALGALPAPPGQQRLASSAKQVIDREVAYLAAVASVLNHPTVAGASQLQTLESNLTSALTAAGPAVAGEQPTVSGADRLTSWARTTSRTLNRRAAAKRAKARARARARGGSSAGSAPVVSNPYGNGTGCGGGLYAGPNTSCAFAENVRDAYNQAPGARASVRVYSPVTDRTYTMSCAPSGNGVTCAGGDNASVTF